LLQDLTNKGYKKLKPSVLTSSEDAFLTDNELESKFYDDGENGYNYLIDLSDRMRTNEIIIKKNETLSKTTNLFNELNDKQELFTGQLEWLEELNNLKKSIEEGLKTDWQYDNKDKYMY
jgi:hypothetical protein